jgi:hypothetical protein
MKKYFSLLLVLVLAALFVACGDSPGASSSNVIKNPNDTPTEAYKRLFAAVKSKDTQAIKAEMSKNTQDFTEFVAAQQKKTVEEVYANGYSQTTFAETLPQIRDERVKDKMGALEVWNAKENKWDDVPFIREEEGWKLAVGDAFKGTWNSPGKGRDAREKEAANALSGNNMINGLPNSNSKSNPAANVSK